MSDLPADAGRTGATMLGRLNWSGVAQHDESFVSEGVCCSLDALDPGSRGTVTRNVEDRDEVSTVSANPRGLLRSIQVFQHLQMDPTVAPMRRRHGIGWCEDAHSRGWADRGGVVMLALPDDE
jgi:hypothetical protein